MTIAKNNTINGSTCLKSSILKNPRDHVRLNDPNINMQESTVLGHHTHRHYIYMGAKSGISIIMCDELFVLVFNILKMGIPLR